MANLAITDARNLFTTEMVASFSDRTRPKAFFRSFFSENETAGKSVSIEVERDNQSIAVDVIRGTEGNRNTWDLSTQKMIVPPYYNEYFDATDLAAYEALYVEPNPVISSANFGSFLKAAQKKMEGIMDKVDRAYELQAAQALVDGIVVLKNGINIDFKRKAGSLIAFGAGNDWSLVGIDPNIILLQGATFLKEVGKMEGAVINVVMGSLALNAYLNNTFVKARAAAQQYGLDSIIMAQRNALGQSYHGRISVGSFNCDLWSYPDTYKHPVSGTITKYMHDKKILMLPQVTSNVLAYAAVPQLLSTGVSPKQGKFLAYEFLDEKNTSHQMGVKSAGIAIPVAVDQAFTAQVLA